MDHRGEASLRPGLDAILQRGFRANVRRRTWRSDAPGAIHPSRAKGDDGALPDRIINIHNIHNICLMRIKTSTHPIRHGEIRLHNKSCFSTNVWPKRAWNALKHHRFVGTRLYHRCTRVLPINLPPPFAFRHSTGHDRRYSWCLDHGHGQGGPDCTGQLGWCSYGCRIQCAAPTADAVL